MSAIGSALGGIGDLSNVFKIVNLIVGILSILGGISQFFPVGFQSTIIAIYVILFGLGIIGLGRGVFYVFIGTILLHDHVLRIIAGSIIALIGVFYIILEFIPSMEPPASMRLQTSDYENATDTV